MVDTRREFVTVLAREDLDVNDLALLAMRNFQTRVAYFARLLAEDRAEQPLLSRQLGLTLGRDLAHEDVFRANFRTDENGVLVVVAFPRHERDQHILA